MNTHMYKVKLFQIKKYANHNLTHRSLRDVTTTAGTNAEPFIRHHMMLLGGDELTHWGQIMSYGDIELGQHWLR